MLPDILIISFFLLFYLQKTRNKRSISGTEDFKLSIKHSIENIWKINIVINYVQN